MAMPIIFTIQMPLEADNSSSSSAVCVFQNGAGHGIEYMVERKCIGIMKSNHYSTEKWTTTNPPSLVCFLPKCYYFTTPNQHPLVNFINSFTRTGTPLCFPGALEVLNDEEATSSHDEYRLSVEEMPREAANQPWRK